MEKKQFPIKYQRGRKEKKRKSCGDVCLLWFQVFLTFVAFMIACCIRIMTTNFCHMFSMPILMYLSFLYFEINKKKEKKPYLISLTNISM